MASLTPICSLPHPLAAREQAEAEARQDTVAATLVDRERRLAEARAGLDKCQKESRHVDSQRNRLTVQLEEVEGQLREARQVGRGLVKWVGGGEVKAGDMG